MKKKKDVKKYLIRNKRKFNIKKMKKTKTIINML